MAAATKQQINWGLFCDPFSTRFALREPWINNGIKYATNSRVLIAIPTDEPDTPEDGLRRPNCESVLEAIEKPGESVLWPIDLHKCGLCQGSFKTTCDECHGVGWRECDMGHEHACSNCDDDGKQTCEDCSVEVVQMGVHRISHMLVAITRTLPGIVGWSLVGAKHTDPLYFRFGNGGRGAVMGMADRAKE